MLYRLIKTNRVVSYFILPILAIAAWMMQLLQPETYNYYPGENHMPLFRPVENLLAGYPLISSITGIVLVIISAIIILRINMEYGFFRSRTILPAVIFLLIAVGFRKLHTLHPVHIAILLFLFAVYRLFNAFDLRKPYSQIFDATFLLSIGSLFYLNMVVLLPAFVAGGIILGRETHWREYIVALAGFLVPWILTFSWHYLFDKIPGLIEVLVQNSITANNWLPGNQPVMAFTGFILLLTILGSLILMSQYGEKKVGVRHFFIIFFLIFATVVLSIVVVPAASAEAILIAALPLSFLISNHLLSLRKQFWGEIIIYLLIGFSLSMQFL